MAANFGSLPFSEQIAFFRQKLNLGTQAWTDIWQAQHDRAFVVAGAMKEDLLNDLRDAVDRVISEGITFEMFKKDFLSVVSRNGWSGWTGEGTKAGEAWRARVIYDTNLRTSYAAGRLTQMKAIADELPYWRYRHNDAVASPRPEHQAWDGLVLRSDDPFWSTHYPPNGWGCFTGDTPTRCDARLGLKTWYAGEMVELHTRLGHRLTVTANHPILTRRGWMAAHTLKEGDELIGAAGEIDSMMRGVIDHEEPPARAEDLFETLAVQGLRVAPVSPADFHGDAHLRKPEINIAGADSELVDVVQAALREHGRKSGLDAALHGCVETADVAGGAPPAALVVMDVIVAEDAAHRRLGDAEPLRDSRLAGEAAAIEREDFPLDDVVTRVGLSPRLAELSLGSARCALDGQPAQPLGLGAPAQRDAAQPQGAAEGATTASSIFCELLETNPGAVAIDQVVKIRKFEWAGHVFDFVTLSGLIMAGGVIVSNCRCYVEPLSAADLASLGKAAPDTAPPIELQEKIVGANGPSPRTVLTPKGIDPGFGYQPGAAPNVG